jgi:hypothetical protein
MAAADLVLSVIVGAGGTAQAVVRTRTALQTWTVSQVSVSLPTAPIGATCDLRKDGVLITPLIPTGDAASGDPPVTLRPGETLTVNFAGCTPGAAGTVYLIYDDGTPA